jgi:hypothetical protein
MKSLGWKLTVTELIKIFSTVYKIWKFNTTVTRIRHWSSSGDRWNPYSNTSIHIILPYYAMLLVYYAILYYTILHHTMLCYAYSSILYYSYSIIYNIIISKWSLIFRFKNRVYDYLTHACYIPFISDPPSSACRNRYMKKRRANFEIPYYAIL